MRPTLPFYSSLGLAVLLFANVGGHGCSSDSSSTATPGERPADGVSAPDPHSVTLDWDAPTTRNDGSPLADLSGYVIRYGSSPRAYTSATPIGPSPTYTIRDLASGTHYFAVTALDSGGSESELSNEVSKVIP